MTITTNRGEYSGVLYVFDPVRDNEPTPPRHIDKYMQGNITPIGLHEGTSVFGLPLVLMSQNPV